VRRVDFPEKKLLGNMSDATVKARRQALEDWVSAVLLGADPTLLRARAAVVAWLNSERGLGGLQPTSSRGRTHSDGVTPQQDTRLNCSDVRTCTGSGVQARAAAAPRAGGRRWRARRR
jgi:hypothetical protein